MKLEKLISLLFIIFLVTNFSYSLNISDDTKYLQEQENERHKEVLEHKKETFSFILFLIYVLFWTFLSYYIFYKINLKNKERIYSNINTLKRYIFLILFSIHIVIIIPTTITGYYIGNNVMKMMIAYEFFHKSTLLFIVLFWFWEIVKKFMDNPQSTIKDLIYKFKEKSK